MKFEMKINGRKVTSASQIERELMKAAEHAVEESAARRRGRASGSGRRARATSQKAHRIR